LTIMDIAASVIVPVYNDTENLKKNLAALLDTGFKGFEVIVVDDHSEKDLSQAMQPFPCRLIPLPENRGQAYARNAGARQSRGDILVFTDSDCMVMKDWVRAMVELLGRLNTERKDIVAVCGRVASNGGFIQRCHDYTGYAHVQQGSRRPTEYLNTACAAVFKEPFFEAGGFSEDLRVNEDTELGRKLIEKGYTVVWDPSVSVAHDHGIKTFKDFLLKHERWGEQGANMFLGRGKAQKKLYVILSADPLSSFILVVPFAFLTTARIVKYYARFDAKILLYAFFIFLGKVFLRWGIFVHNFEKSRRAG
jgi:cellulose synthase/poly-beta-1,6-N-acetylglucosamine synthase-like glycosyltransferase